LEHVIIDIEYGGDGKGAATVDETNSQDQRQLEDVRLFKESKEYFQPPRDEKGEEQNLISVTEEDEIILFHKEYEDEEQLLRDVIANEKDFIAVANHKHLEEELQSIESLQRDDALGEECVEVSSIIPSEIIELYEEMELLEGRLLEQRVQIRYVKLKLEEEEIVLENNND